MFRGTTPTLYFKINNIEDLHTIDEVWITIKGTSLFLNKTINDVTIDYDENIIILDLSEDETLLMKTPEVKCQLKIHTLSDKVCVSPIVRIPIDDILNNNKMIKAE